MADPVDPIAATEAHFQQLQEERLPAGQGMAPWMADYQTRQPAKPADLVSSAVQARQALEGRRQQIIQQIPYANRGQSRAFAAELRGIEQQQSGMDRADAMQQRQANFDQSMRQRDAFHAVRDKDREITLDRRSAIDEHAAGAMDYMMNADQLFRSGQMSKEDHDNALADVPNRFPMALNNPSAAAHLRFSSELADRLNSYKERQNFRDAAQVARQYGVGVQTDENGDPSIEATRQAAAQTPRGKAEQMQYLNQEFTRKYGIPGGLSTIFNPVEAHVGTDEKGNQVDNPTHIRLSGLDKKGDAIHFQIPMTTFNQIKSEFQPAYQQIQGTPTPTTEAGTPTPATPADPRASLAQKALTDPNASEAHKAAARQILGLQ